MDETTSELTPRESWDLLATTDVGRLAVCVGEVPEIFPVNYVVSNGTLVFRTAAGLKHITPRLHGVVCLEADQVDRESGVAWSVVVQGRAHDITAPHELEFALALPLRPMHAGAKPFFVRIDADRVTGRRLHLAPGSVGGRDLCGTGSGPLAGPPVGSAPQG